MLYTVFGIAFFITFATINLKFNAVQVKGEPRRFLIPVHFGGCVSFLLGRRQVTILENERALQTNQVRLQEQINASEALNATLEARINSATSSLRQREWFMSGQNELNALLCGDKGTALLAEQTLTFFVDYLDAGIGQLDLYSEADDSLSIIASYAVARDQHHQGRIPRSEGLVGQTARERKRIQLDAVPQDYQRIESALAEAHPLNLLVLPILIHGRLIGVLEVGSFRALSPNACAFLDRAIEGIGIAITVNHARSQVNELLAQS